MVKRGRQKKPSNRDIRGVPFRVYLSADQRKLMTVYLGHTRWIWNYLLGLKEAAWREIGTSYTRTITQSLLPGLKREYPWLREVHSQVLQDVNFRLHQAYENYFEGRARKPRFKSKKDTRRRSFTFPQNRVGEHVAIRVNWDAGTLTLPGFGEMRANLHRNEPLFCEASILSATLREKNGKYYVSISFDVGECQPLATTVQQDATQAGDLGLKDLLVTNRGKRVPNLKPLQGNLKHLSRLQRKLERSLRLSNPKNYAPDFTVVCEKSGRLFHRKGAVKTGKHNWHYSQNALRLKRQIAILHDTIANQRRDHHHKTAAMWVDDSQAIGMETLRVKNMVKLKSLARHIQDSGWGQLCRLVEARCRRQGKPFVKHDPFLPSTKLCSTPGCAYLNRALTLRDREWRCPVCGTLHDRDVNAAKVLYYETILALKAQGIVVTGAGSTSAG